LFVQCICIFWAGGVILPYNTTYSGCLLYNVNNAVVTLQFS